jgi:hypothetical protein
MIGNGRPRRYRVSISGAVGTVIKQLAQEAAATARSPQFIDALLVINHRLRTDPHAFGEMTGNLHPFPWIAHTGSVAPLTVQFAIDEEHAVVYLRRIILRSI